MSESGKSSSIVNSFSTLLLEVWQKWDVRGMVLFSLTLQIVLSYLGWRRKYAINNLFSKTILWFAYLGADWIAIATLGKLSSSYNESPTTNVLRAYWAPLLLLHLGGPDTITAYAFEDNRLWIRHLLILLVKAIFVVYVICLSWTFSWLSFLSLPLILAGIIKYVEKILCLKLNNSQKTKSVIFSNFNLQGPQPIESSTFDRLQIENPTTWGGYLLFIIMRPDVNDYHSSPSFSSTTLRIQTCIEETIGIDDPSKPFRKFGDIFSLEYSFSLFAVALEFIYDVVYTKVALIYTELGFWLRLTSFVSSFSVLLLFFINIINEPKFHFSRVDIVITGILLVGAIALELYAAWVMLSSKWAIFVAAFHHNVLVRKIFCVALRRLPCLLHQGESWSNKIGQFDLLKYCLRYKKKKGADRKNEKNKKMKGNQSGSIRQKISRSDIIEMWRKYMFTKFGEVPTYLMDIYNFLNPVISFMRGDSIQPSRGENALKKIGQYDNLKWSIKLDFDYSIILWHLATSVCYYQEHQGDDDNDDTAEISKKVSDYMMYLLVMCPALILPDQSKSFWFDHTYDELKDLLFFATDTTNATSTLLSNPDNVDEKKHESSDESTMENLQGEVSAAIDMRNVASRGTTLKQVLKREVFDIATFLKPLENRWELLREVWIEMLVYAAISSQNTSHVKQLGEGIEFLSLIWLSVDLNIIYQSIDRKESIDRDE